MSKQLILITAPFKCGHCDKALKELPLMCEEKKFEFIEMKNEKNQKPEDKLPVNSYPTIMVRVNEEIKEIINGYNPNKIKTIFKKY